MIDKLHKIAAFGELVNPLFYCKETGDAYRLKRSQDGIKIIKNPQLKKITHTRQGYISTAINGKDFTIHAIVCVEFLGHSINGYTSVINHKDGNKLNNKLDNLEIVTVGENIRHGWKNRKRSGLPENVLHSHKGKFKAVVRIGNKYCHLGEYSTVAEAEKAAERGRYYQSQNTDPSTIRDPLFSNPKFKSQQ